jgi:hypothetical protein
MRVAIRVFKFALCLLLAAGTWSAYAFERPFPQIAKRGTLSLTDYPTVTLDGKVRKLSPGAWIRNENNTSEVPVMLRGREFTVNYTENSEGDIDRVWILSSEEQKKPAPSERQ